MTRVAVLWATLAYCRRSRTPAMPTGRVTAATTPRRDIPRSRRSIATTCGQLALAWQYDTGEKGDTQTQPIVVGRTLFGYTPSHKTFALDAATGKQLWLFDSGISGTGANRGLMHWTDGKDARVFAAVDNFVYALNAATGKPVDSFRQEWPHRPAREPRP